MLSAVATVEDVGQAIAIMAIHLIGPHDDQQAAMLDDKLLAKYAPDDKQRFNQLSQVGQVLDQLLDACLELYLPGYSDLEEFAADPIVAKY
jgi:hypothetical protein